MVFSVFIVFSLRIGYTKGGKIAVADLRFTVRRSGCSLHPGWHFFLWLIFALTVAALAGVKVGPTAGAGVVDHASTWGRAVLSSSGLPFTQGRAASRSGSRGRAAWYSL